MPKLMDLNADNLGQFTGTEVWYKHALVPAVTYTEGVQYVAEHGGAYWLLDEIAFANVFSSENAQVRAEAFQVWKLVVVNNTAVLTCEDGNGNVVMTKKISFTDFPLPEITLWYTDHVILLPSEY